ncbi:MAG: sulfotransferase, partial [Candidatus Hermodarchaeota archaeon]
TKYKAIGEITPNYIFKEEVPNRIQKNLNNIRFIIMLRNPVNRAFSSYKYSILNEGIKETFIEHLSKDDDVFKRGLYYEQIKRWINYFPIDQFLILIFEEVVKEPEIAFKKIAEFLSIDYRKFKLQNLCKKINPSGSIPRFHSLYVRYQRFLLFLKKKNLYKLYKIIIKIYLKFKNRLKSSSLVMKENITEMNPNDQKNLFTKYESDIKNLEKLLNKNLSLWRP